MNNPENHLTNDKPTDRRLLVVVNEHSTEAKNIQREVIRPLTDRDIPHEVFFTRSPNFSNNVSDMAETLRDGDRIVIAAGDGTVSQVVNAVLLGGHDAQLAPLPFGGFVDLADKKATIMDAIRASAPVEDRIPLSIRVDQDHWRYAPGYATLGFTAIAAASFDTEKSRERMGRAYKYTKRLFQIAQLGEEYFKHRNSHLPPYYTSESPAIRQAVTDVLLLNSNRTGGIIRSATDYGMQNYFGYVEADVSSVIQNLPFGLKALTGHAPAEHFRSITLNFVEPSIVPIQTEGEFELLENTESIEVSKFPDTSVAFVRL